MTDGKIKRETLTKKTRTKKFKKFLFLFIDSISKKNID